MATEHSTTTISNGDSATGDRRDLGEILVAGGYLRREQLDEALKAQADRVRSDGSTAPRLGEILVEKGFITPDAVAMALGEQSRLLLFCPRCVAYVNVDPRPDAVGYGCAKCQGALQAPPAGLPARSTDSSVIISSALPVPPEVQELREDPAKRFGKYIILEKIGRGGVAEVFRAWDTYLHQFVALKRIKPVARGDEEERHSRLVSLLNEAHNAIRLRHPNIVSVYDIGRVAREYYISMEFLDGWSLHDAVLDAHRRGKLSPYYEDPKRWTDILLQTAAALHYAHTRPIPTLHCDLKPGNVFVTKDGRVCVLDFGLARQLGDMHTEGGVIVGTPSYMAPEQATGSDDQIDARTDVYGIGAILYELLSGRPPFVGSMYEILRRAVDEPPVAPSRVVRLKQESGEAPKDLPVIPPALEALCLRCLEKQHAARPQSALEVVKAIESILKDRPSVVLLQSPAAEPKAAPEKPPAASARRYIAILEKRRRQDRIKFLVAALVLAVGTWFAIALGLGGSSGGDARTQLGRFRPDLVSALDSDSADFKVWAASLQVFKRRLAEAVESEKPHLPRWEARDRTWASVKAWRVKSDGLVFDAGSGPDALSWSEIGPAGVEALARACGLPERPEDRLGLAVYYLCAGDLPRGRRLLEGLRGTALESDGARLLARLGR
jgi:serine/threonine protein kinase